MDTQFKVFNIIQDHVILTPFTIHSDDDEPSEMTEDQKSIHHLSASPTPFFDPVVASLSLILSLPPDCDSNLGGDRHNFFLIMGSDFTEVDMIYSIRRGEISDDPSEAKNSEIDSLIKGPSDTFLMGEDDIKLNLLEIYNLVQSQDNPILDIQNKESDESETETIMDESN
ncbi:hypothetical protein Tco_1209380 [Tanacetum coccineum]